MRGDACAKTVTPHPHGVTCRYPHPSEHLPTLTPRAAPLTASTRMHHRSIHTSHTRSQAEVTLSIWDLGGDRSYVSMLPMVCVDAVAVLFMFDLTSLASLSSVREWYRQVRGLNKAALPFLVGECMAAGP